MNAKQARWLVASSLAIGTLAGCEKVDCDKTPEKEICQDDFLDDDDGGTEDEDATVPSADGGARLDGGRDASSDASASLDGSARDGSVSGNDGSMSSTSLTVTEFCEAQLAAALAWRDAFDTCCPGAKPAAVTTFLSGVVAYVEDAVGRCEDLRKAPITAMKITYDGSKAGACASAYAQAYALPPATCPTDGFDLEILEGMIGHGAQALAQIASCREAFKGSTKQGQACEDQLECASGLRCAGETGKKTCQNTVASSGTCNSNSECADGLTCVGSSASGGKQCRELAGSSGKCERSSECETSFVCRASGSNPAQCVSAKTSAPVCK
jgi:hypothetical protein